MNHSNKKLKIYISKQPTLLIRSICKADLKHLRDWKNENKKFFFSQEEITENMQLNWYTACKNKPYDLMFMVEYNLQVIGCLGIRLQEDHWDVYNVILGVQEFGGRGIMGLAFDAMLSCATSLKAVPISLKVLIHNPAVKFYQKHGFEILSTEKSFYLMLYKSNYSKKENL